MSDNRVKPGQNSSYPVGISHAYGSCANQQLPIYTIQAILTLNLYDMSILPYGASPYSSHYIGQICEATWDTTSQS